jgi:hypothetical protein
MPRGPVRSTVCRICGAPRSTKNRAPALCDEHLREQWRDQAAAKRAAHHAAPAVEAPALPVPAAPAAERITLRVTGAYVEMTLDTLRQLLANTSAPPGDEAAPPQAAAAVPAPEPAQAIALIDRGLSCAQLGGFIQRDTLSLDPDPTLYARQLEALRAEGYLICVEG